MSLTCGREVSVHLCLGRRRVCARVSRQRFNCHPMPYSYTPLHSRLQAPGPLTAGSDDGPQRRANHGGPTTAGQPRRANHSGPTTAGQPRRANHGGPTRRANTAGQPRRGIHGDLHCRTLPAGHPEHPEHRGRKIRGELVPTSRSPSLRGRSLRRELMKSQQHRQHSAAFWWAPKAEALCTNL